MKKDCLTCIDIDEDQEIKDTNNIIPQWYKENGNYPNRSAYVRVKDVFLPTPQYFDNNGTAQEEPFEIVAQNLGNPADNTYKKYVFHSIYLYSFQSALFKEFFRNVNKQK